MKIKDCWVIMVILLLILGIILYYERRLTIAKLPPGYMWAKMGTDASETSTVILLPAFNRTYEQIEELKAQNQWLRHSLGKCLERLEAERGLKPILPKHHLPLRGDTNLAGNYSEEYEPWFEAYEEPNVPSMLEDPNTNVKQLVCMMGIMAASDRLYIEWSASWIEVFEKRLKRLEEHLSK